MSTLQTSQKTSRRQELRDDSVVELFARLVLFYENNRTLVYGLAGGLVALALAVPGYLYYQQQQAEEANQLLGRILPTYEQGQYRAALEGTADRQGLAAIASDFGSTPAGNLAAYYAGDAHYQLGEYDQAMEFFQQFDKQEDFFGASAYAAQGAIYENRGEYEQAAQHYEEAASHYENQLTTPRYLLQAGQAYEEAGNYQAAAEAYRSITQDYADAPQASDAERFLARVQVRIDAAS
jgi:tetratricopeptide (TPR) repeat protein